MARILHMLFALALCLPLSSVLAGPNADGTLLLHANPSLHYTTDSDAYCSLSALSSCAQAVTSVSGAETFVIQAIAAFPDGSAPRLSGVTFGVQYDAGVTMVDHGSCGDFLLADTSWPASGTGAAVAWSAPGTSLLEPVYWFAAYNYNAPTAAHLALTPHPVQGGSFGDDDVPSALDPIAAFGAIGFDTPGTPACPSPLVDPGACCFPHQECVVYSAAVCEELGGAYQGTGTSCAPNPCPPDPGACCFPDGSCLFVGADECTGDFQGIETRCDPNPCPPPLGACCVPAGQCYVITQTGCIVQQGSWLGMGTDCEPDPCPSQASGACCYADGSCSVVRELACATQGGTFRGPDTVCNPDGTCPGPIGACCYNVGCNLRSVEQCEADQGEFAGEGTSCDPNPCDLLPRGACCFDVGSCLVLTAATCVQYGGQFSSEGTDCDPNPCPAPPSGACCLPDTRCVDETVYECDLVEGTWLGAGTLCSAAPCPGTGACCTPQGTCIIAGADLCAELGSFLGAGVPCEPNPCGVPNGCQPYEGAVPRGWRSAERASPPSDVADEPIAAGRSPRWSARPAGSRSDESSGDPPCGAEHMTSDGQYEWIYAWGYEGIAGEDYGAFAECYAGSGRVCAITLDLEEYWSSDPSYIDLFVWEDDGGCPGNLICKKSNVLIYGLYGDMRRYVISMPNCCVSGTWWVGFRANEPGQQSDFYVGADLDGALGCAVTKIAPGLGYPEGWQHTSWVFGPTQSLGIGAYLSECDEVTGACCAPWGGCMLASSATCEKQDGMYLGDGVPCDPDPCPHVGACCTHYYGHCYVTWEQSCEGDYFGDDTLCDPDPCPEFILGACCRPGGHCTFTNYRNCVDPKYPGHFLGVDSDCDPNPCITPTGACCAGDGTCSLETAEGCEAAGGQYVGDGSVCEPSPCVPVSVKRASWGQIKSRFREGASR